MSEEIYDLIQSYLDNSMPALERTVFEQRLLLDEHLKAEFETAKEIESQLGDQELQAFRTKVKKIVDSEKTIAAPTLSVVKDKNRSLILSLAAAILLLVCAVLVFNKAGQQPDLASMATEYFIPYPADVQSRGGASQNEVYNEYRDGSYGKSAIKLEEYARLNNDDEAKLFAAISYLAIQNPSKSILLLNEINQTPSLINKVNYYKGIAHLRLENQIKAKKAFLLINNGDQFLYNKAQEVLSKME